MPTGRLSQVHSPETAEPVTMVHHKPGYVRGRGLHKGWYKRNRGKHKGWRRWR